MQAVHRRRRVTAAVLVLVVVAALVLVTRGCGGGSDTVRSTTGSAAATAPEPPQLPGGGRTILPGHRVVAFYGAPQDEQLGTLGIGTPDEAGRRLLKLSQTYQRVGRREVLPAMELIAVVAAAHPGEDGMYRTRVSEATIRRYLRAARRIKALLILDIQPGRSDFLRETVRLRRWLAQPDVSLALDPEWRVDAASAPGQVIGSVSAEEVNAVSFWLDRLARERDLPQKLLLIHRFTADMIRDQDRLKPRERLAMAINIDGFGGRAIKRAKYQEFAHPGDRFFDGFKLFYEEDTDLLRPRQVARLRPPPDIVVYE
jgi:hypothetical protein